MAKRQGMIGQLPTRDLGRGDADDASATAAIATDYSTTGYRGQGSEPFLPKVEGSWTAVRNRKRVDELDMKLKT
jgi:hypothetical protein